MSQSQLLEKLTEFRQSVLTDIITRSKQYMSNAVARPHNLTSDEMQELELIHYQMNDALMRFRYGELDEKLDRGDIGIREWARLKMDIKSPYYELFKKNE